MSSCRSCRPSCVSFSLSSSEWSWFPRPLWSMLVSSLRCRFRYFTLPIVLLVCLVKPKAHPILSMILSGSLNGIVIYLFVFRPFTWGDGSVARFMWCLVCSGESHQQGGHEFYKLKRISVENRYSISLRTHYLH